MLLILYECAQELHRCHQRSRETSCLIHIMSKWFLFFSIEGEGEVAFFSAKRWDRRNRADLIESATPCHDAQVVGLYRDSNPLRLTILAAMSEDYTTAPQHLHIRIELLQCRSYILFDYSKLLYCTTGMTS